MMVRVSTMRLTSTRPAIRAGSSSACSWRATAGLQVGDQIIAVDGQDVTGGAAYLYSALTRVAPGTVIHLGLARGVTLDVTTDKAR